MRETGARRRSFRRFTSATRCDIASLAVDEFEKVADAKVKEGPWADELTKEMVEKMKVPQLQAALDDRNLDTTGLKATLKKRLLGAIDDGKTNQVCNCS